MTIDSSFWHGKYPFNTPPDKIEEFYNKYPEKKGIPLNFFPKQEVVSPPLPVFSLTQSDIDFCSRLIPPIKELFESGYAGHRGVSIRNTHTISTELGTKIIIKQPRHNPLKLFQQIKIEESAALKIGVRNFAPSYLVDGLIAQKFLEQPLMTWQARKSQEEAFVNHIKPLLGDLDGLAIDNYIVTENGVAIIDILSCGFSKKSKD